MTELVFKIIGLGLLISVAHQILMKSGRDEQAMLLTLSGIVAVVMLLIGEIAELLNMMEDLFGL